jgi:hypothetical protein
VQFVECHYFFSLQSLTASRRADVMLDALGHCDNDEFRKLSVGALFPRQPLLGILKLVANNLGKLF